MTAIPLLKRSISCIFIYICLMLWYQSIPVWLQSFFPRYTWQIPGSNGKDVYLTFDDGPHPDITLWVVEQLEKRNLKATFFCVGDNARKYPETLQIIKNKGHQTGNHTMHHLKGWNHSLDDYIRDVKDCHQLVDSQLFRPPYGRIKRSQARALSNDYKIIMWSLLSCDFDQKVDTEKALKGLMNKTTNGSIVVFHDSVKAEKNLKKLLPPYLDFLNENGFICKTF